ncbi:MAG: hypothetical protein HQ541_04365 [Mariniphaga sp.]|nr:hypothetical protein [Mariniphaga sp.]
MKPEFRIKDKVTIKSLAWYNKKKNCNGDIYIDSNFVSTMSLYCGKTTTIRERFYDPVFKKYVYRLEVDNGEYDYNEWMFNNLKEKIDLL